MFIIYLLTCQHQSSAGCFRLPDAYAAADLGWDTDRLRGARAPLVTSDMIAHDEETEEYFVRRWFRHNPPTNGKHLQGIKRLISDMESDAVRESAEQELDEHHASRNPVDNPPNTLAGGFGDNRLTSSRYMRGER